MTRRQRNKLASHAAVAVVLGDHATDVAGIPGLPEKTAALQAALDEIHRLAITQIQPTEPGTIESERLLAEMVDAILGIAGLVTAVARGRAEPELARSVRVSRESFRQLPRRHRIWLAQRVLEIAGTVVTELGAFGVTGETLSAIQARIDAASDGIELTRGTLVMRHVATRELAAQMRAVGALLTDEIDRLIFFRRKERPALYAAYQAARTVVDRAGGRARAPGVSDSAAGRAAVDAPTLLVPVSADEQAA